MTIEERVENLERELRRVKQRNLWLLGALVLLAGGLIAFAVIEKTTSHKWTKVVPNKVIRAKGFILEDKNGKTRAELALNEGGPHLSLFDENFIRRVGLAVFIDKGPLLSMFGENGIIGAQLDMGKNASGLYLYNKDSDSKAFLAVYRVGPILALSDEKGRFRAMLRIEQYGSEMILLGPDGKEIWSAPKP